MHLQWHGLGPVAIGQNFGQIISQTDNIMSKRTTTKKAGERTFAPIITGQPVVNSEDGICRIADNLGSHCSQRELTELCREHGVPIQKGKDNIAHRLASHIAANAKEVILVIR